MFFTALLLLLLLCLTLFSAQAGEGVRQGLLLSYRALLPALFPSMVLCSMIGALADQIPLPPSITVWLASLLCGFPLGIRTLTQGYHRGLFTKEETLRLSVCCSNASPAFLITYIGEGILKSREAGLCLFLGQLLISLNCGLLLGVFHQNRPLVPKEQRLMLVITESIAAGAAGGVQLTGYVTIFAVVASLLNGFAFFDYFYPFLELCGGIMQLPAKGGILLAAAAAGFSGLSVLLQNGSYLAKEGLSILPMLWGKVAYGLLLPFLVTLPNAIKILPFLLLFTLFCAIFHKTLTNREKRGIIRKNKQKDWENDFFKRDRKNLRLLRAWQSDRRHR